MVPAQEAAASAMPSAPAAPSANFGMVMKNVLATHKGRVDGKLVQRLASEILE